MDDQVGEAVEVQSDAVLPIDSAKRIRDQYYSGFLLVHLPFGAGTLGHMDQSFHPPQFATTHWSLVLTAAKDAPDASEALATLCQNYWRPLYAYVRRRVADAHEAQDLTQAFFERLLERNYLAEADPQRGRFRAFLLTAFKHFLSKEWAKARTIKRGGDRLVFSLDFASEDSRMGIEPVDHLTPEQIYEQQWAMTLLERVVLRLEQEWNHARKDREFQTLKPFLIGSQQRGYSEAAKELGTTEPAARMAASRLRKRYRELLREEIAQTVATKEDVEDELRRLFTIFRES